jgi:hypothetical protein
MSNKSIRSKEAILRHVERQRELGARPTFVGFAFAFARAMCEPSPLSSSELLLPTLRAAEPPSVCPCCSLPVAGAVRDPNGDWTWNCFGGCNP